MNTLFLDTFSGISGDMMLGLLLDLGVDPAQLRTELAKLPVSGWELEVGPDQRHGIGGTRVRVVCSEDQPHRSWSDIDAMLAESTLSEPAKVLSRKIFRCLGDAEATVHRTPIEQVHFHEVGAVDAIIDIVGTATGLALLQVDKIICAPLPLSSGMTRGQHGAIPLPAPASLEILKGQPVRDAHCDKELVTPTGAAIAASIARFDSIPEMTLEKTGYGIGGWDLADRPNLLRGILGQAMATETDLVSVIETHLDDTPAEWLGSLLEKLLAAGALDAAFSPLQMKKNRPGVRLTVITEPHQVESLSRLILRESSAIGVRHYPARRHKLRRESETVTTDLGPADVKLIYEGDRLLRITPEHASCAELAQTHNRALPEVYRLVTAAANRRFGLE